MNFCPNDCNDPNCMNFPQKYDPYWENEMEIGWAREPEVCTVLHQLPHASDIQFFSIFQRNGGVGWRREGGGERGEHGKINSAH